jgi:putative membrane protein
MSPERQEKAAGMSVLALHAGWGAPGPWIGLAWLVVLVTVVAFFVLRARRGDGFGHRGHGSAEAVLAERYARGQITEDEYRRSRAVLKERDS